MAAPRRVPAAGPDAPGRVLILTEHHFAHRMARPASHQSEAQREAATAEDIQRDRASPTLLTCTEVRFENISRPPFVPGS